MANGTFIAYYRVSTQKQGQSGLGLEAQQTAVMNFLNGGRWRLEGDFTEIESGRNTKTRPQLFAAIEECRQTKATLIIAKLDRLSRDVRFFLEVLDDYGIAIRFSEFPDIDPKTDEGRMILIGMANYAEFEGRRIGTRTKAALAAAKARGVVLGASGAANLKPNVEERQRTAQEHADGLRGLVEGFRLRGLTQRKMVDELNGLKIPTPNGKGGRWGLIQLQRVLARLS